MAGLYGETINQEIPHHAHGHRGHRLRRGLCRAQPAKAGDQAGGEQRARAHASIRATACPEARAGGPEPQAEQQPAATPSEHAVAPSDATAKAAPEPDAKAEAAAPQSAEPPSANAENAGQSSGEAVPPAEDEDANDGTAMTPDDGVDPAEQAAMPPDDGARSYDDGQRPYDVTAVPPGAAPQGPYGEAPPEPYAPPPLTRGRRAMASMPDLRLRKVPMAGLLLKDPMADRLLRKAPMAMRLRVLMGMPLRAPMGRALTAPSKARRARRKRSG